MFVTASPTLASACAELSSAALWLAEDAARELPNPSLADALLLVHLFAERGSPKFEPAARRWLVRYLTEETPSLHAAAKVTASLSPAA